MQAFIYCFICIFGLLVLLDLHIYSVLDLHITDWPCFYVAREALYHGKTDGGYVHGDDNWFFCHPHGLGSYFRIPTEYQAKVDAFCGSADRFLEMLKKSELDSEIRFITCKNKEFVWVFPKRN